MRIGRVLGSGNLRSFRARSSRWARVSVVLTAVVASVALVGPPAPAQTTGGCPDSALEGDDTKAQARPFPVGTVVRRAFCTNGDEDWYYFDADTTTGVGYYVELADHGSPVYTTIYEPGSTQYGINHLREVFADNVATSPTARIFLSVVDGAGQGGPDRIFDIRVRRVVPRNLLVNPGFEVDANNDGRPDGWTSDPRFVRVARGFSGNFSGRLGGTGDYWISSRRIDGIRADRFYRFAARVRVPATTDAFKLKIFTIEKYADGGSFTTGPLHEFTRSTDGWFTVDWGGAGSPTEGMTAAVVQLRAFGFDTAKVFVDDFVYGEYPPLEEPPPPA